MTAGTATKAGEMDGAACAEKQKLREGARVQVKRGREEEDQGCNFSGNYVRLRRKCQRGARVFFKSRNNNMRVTFNHSQKV